METVTLVPPPGPHGGDGARLADALGIDHDDVLDLSMSVNPCAPDVTELVRRHASSVRRYPDPERATEELAKVLGVDAERVLLTNGGAEAIALVAAESPVGRVDEPDFALYVRHLERVAADGPRWRSNPHNPTGALAAADERADVWDEAFYPLAAGEWTRGDEGAVVVGSLTKVFSCPGLRAGYLVTPNAELTARIRDRQPRWSVNALACATIPELIAQADLAAWRDGIARLRGALIEVLAAADVHAEPSDAPYVLLQKAPGLREHLALDGVLVRDTSSFGIAEGVRIAVPDDAGLERLAAAIAGWRR